MLLSETKSTGYKAAAKHANIVSSTADSQSNQAYSAGGHNKAQHLHVAAIDAHEKAANLAYDSFGSDDNVNKHSDAMRHHSSKARHHKDAATTMTEGREMEDQLTEHETIAQMIAHIAGGHHTDAAIDFDALLASKLENKISAATRAMAPELFGGAGVEEEFDTAEYEEDNEEIGDLFDDIADEIVDQTEDVDTDLLSTCLAESLLNEDIESLDELSKETLTSYIKKSATSPAKNKLKRSMNIDRAVDKITAGPKKTGGKRIVRDDATREKNRGLRHSWEMTPGHRMYNAKKHPHVGPDAGPKLPEGGLKSSEAKKPASKKKTAEVSEEFVQNMLESMYLALQDEFGEVDEETFIESFNDGLEEQGIEFYVAEGTSLWKPDTKEFTKKGISKPGWRGNKLKSDPKGSPKSGRTSTAFGSSDRFGNPTGYSLKR